MMQQVFAIQENQPARTGVLQRGDAVDGNVRARWAVHPEPCAAAVVENLDKSGRHAAVPVTCPLGTRRDYSGAATNVLAMAPWFRPDRGAGWPPGDAAPLPRAIALTPVAAEGR